jgi:hypothetical protein
MMNPVAIVCGAVLGNYGHKLDASLLYASKSICVLWLLVLIKGFWLLKPWWEQATNLQEK